MMCSALIVITSIVAPLGSIALAANSFGITAESLCYMSGYGIGDGNGRWTCHHRRQLVPQGWYRDVWREGRFPACERREHRPMLSLHPAHLQGWCHHHCRRWHYWSADYPSLGWPPAWRALSRALARNVENAHGIHTLPLVLYLYWRWSQGGLFLSAPCQEWRGTDGDSPSH